MHISIETVEGKNINLEVEDSSKTVDIKIDGPTRKLCIRLGSDPDPDAFRSDPDPDAFRILFNTLSGKTIVIYVKKSNTIREVMDMYEKREGLPVDKQRMLFSGKQLEEHRTIAYYNINQDSTIHVVSRLCGC